MGLFSFIFGSVNKSNRLIELQRKIVDSSCAMEEIFDLVGNFSQIAEKNRIRDEALGEYLDLCLSQEDISQIMIKYEASKKTLGEIYERLALAGAGQWAGGHYVALSAIAYGPTLEYCLLAKNRGYLDEKSTLEHLAFNLIMYFEKGMVLIPEDWIGELN